MITYIIIFILLLIAELLYFRIADKCNIIDKPNERSSHSTIVLRGGGIIFLIGIWIWSAFFGFQYPWFLVGLTLVAGISFVDDIHSLPDSVRLVAQFAAATMAFYQLGILHWSMSVSYTHLDVYKRQLSKHATKRLIQKIKNINPNVIQLHNLHGYYLNIPILFDYLKQSGIPVVWTLHDCWAFTGHCVHYTCVKCNRWKTGCYACPRKNSYPNSFVFDRSRQNYAMKKKTYADIPNMTLSLIHIYLLPEVFFTFVVISASSFAVSYMPVDGLYVFITMLVSVVVLGKSKVEKLKVPLSFKMLCLLSLFIDLFFSSSLVVTFSSVSYTHLPCHA